ncbi:TonB-dependent receptor [Granulicella cerasi]|uniref:TonB-dependent receptor n=1 Tax=Granulicella cerasi TaxID=741063 RepID=UPI0021DFD1DA|nr:carboxypeptidase-like regulatory domain-containing protein [Granulicella cerasi]
MSSRNRVSASLLFAVASAAASAQVVGGNISGVVTDPSGAVIPKAHITIHNDDTGSQRDLVSSSSGSFTAPSLTVGHYTITVDAPGFAAFHRSDNITVGQTLEVNLKLALSGSETVTVNGDLASSVNLSTEQTSGLVNARQVKELPLNGRSYDQLLTLNPGVVNYTNQRSGSTGTSNSSVGSMFSISGRRPQDNLFLLNGIEYTGASLINTTPGGTSGQLLGIDGVHEFNVVTDTYSAAYGKRDGAQISIVSQNGTNQLHGSAYGFERNSFLDARNYFDNARIPEFQRHVYGAAVGGPIKKDKLFLFGNYEGYRQNLGVSLQTLVPDNNARAGFVPNPTTGALVPVTVAPNSAKLLNLWPVANGAEVTQNGIPTGIAKWTGSAPQRIREDFGTTRFDWNIGSKDNFYSTYTIDDSYANTPSGNPYTYVQETLREQVFSAQEQHVFSPRLLNIARFGFSRSSFYFYGYVPAAQQALAPTVRPGVPTYAVVISGSTASNGASAITGAGANVGSNNAIARNLFTFDDHLYYTVGKHTFQGGVWVQRLQSNDNLAQNQYGQASFASLTTFLQGTIKTFTYAPTITPLGWRATYVDGFIEDTWHITPNFEVRAGIRTESSTGWSEAQSRASVYTFTNNVISTNPTSGLSNALTDNKAKILIEPRLGFAWNVFGNGTTSVTGGVGFHHTLLDALDYRLDQAAPYNTTYSYSTGSTVANPVAGTGKVSPSTVDSGMATPALLSYTLKVEQQLAPSTTLSVAYSGSHSYHQIMNGDLNEPAFTRVNGRVFYPASGTPTAPAAPVYANPNVANTTSWWAGASGNYNALIVDVRHDLRNGLQFRGNYTWAKNLDDGSAWNTSVSSNTPAFVSVPQLPHLDYGRAATDLRHIAAINATYELPFGDGKHFLGKTNGFTSRVISGWSLSSIVNLLSGFPFSPQLGYNPTGSGDSRNPVRPDVNVGFTGQLYTKGTTAQRVAKYFDYTAFSAPAAGYVGNVGRDTLSGPHYANVDASLLKNTRITERVHVQFRAEFFNVLNHTNLALPNTIVYTAGPTQGTLASQATTPQYGSPGVISSTANTSRQIQLGAKILF